ncbi:uncharacterized protein LOC116004084 [Ipomoea triloba]|uniref:uncharacterized protein LOC116004084 n=1 Tax=Ipomoea triloba TaxID=35885 RepID=UPI00125DB76D|nr:uncharacterized protein LOC116004084 [Ipomoea triloba]
MEKAIANPTIGSMWNKRGPADDSAGDGDDRDKAIAKTAGFVVFSGIAMSIIKALNPFNNNTSLKNGDNESTQPQVLKQWQPQELPPLPPPPQPPSEPIKSTCCSEQNAVEPSPKVFWIIGLGWVILDSGNYIFTS